MDFGWNVEEQAFIAEVRAFLAMHPPEAFP